MQGNDKLERLKEIDREYRLLSHTAAILHWDQETYMPEAAVLNRADQLSLLSGLMHDRITQPEIGETLTAIGVSLDADPTPRIPDTFQGIERAFLRELARQYRRNSKIPRRVVTELAKQTAIGQRVWAEARKAADFSKFSGQLSIILALVRDVSSCLGYEDHPYDPLLDEFEPWMKTADVEEVFSGLRQGLKQLLDKIRGSRKKVDTDFLNRKYGIDKQRTFGIKVLESLGYDFTRGRLDESAHPFTTTLGSSDVRITTRYDSRYFPTAIFGTIHECGHGLYELGFGKAVQGTLLADGASLGIHESQSRLMENLIGRSYPFWSHYYPQLKALFPESLGDVDLRRFYEGINHVSPSFIRVEADEVTYNLHILLRFGLEKQLIGEDLAVNDLPAAWNAQMKELLGLEPRNDTQGVLQDIHWSGGMVGYFPTYSLGNLYAAQFFNTLIRDIPDWRNQIGRGRFQTILNWLRENIHKHARIYSARELCARVTGEPLNPRYLLDYLAEKFGEIYGF
ncbi:MAG: carboxypeptidase M32 [Spirochaetaceae bacterium]|nr:MAG: carboxypeptidase M32 [Spirochaetaceae bacterium]